MAAAYSAGSNSGLQSGSASYSWSHTFGASDNYFIVGEGNADSSPTTITSVTCGGVNMTQLGSVSNTGNFESSIWGLASPGTGTKTILVTQAIATTFQGATGLSFTGASGGPGLVVSNSSTTTQAPNVSPTGGGSNDIYVATTHTFATSITSSGSNQTARETIVNIDGATSISADTIPGSFAGNFAWTDGSGASNGWTAIGVVLLGSAGASPPPGSIIT